MLGDRAAGELAPLAVHSLLVAVHMQSDYCSCHGNLVQQAVTHM